MTIEAANIGARIMQAREARGFTITQTAARLGIAPASLQDWESGAAMPEADRLQTLASVLEISIVWLVGGELDHQPTHLTASRIEIVAEKLERAKALQLELNGLLTEISIDIAEIQHLEAELDELAA